MLRITSLRGNTQGQKIVYVQISSHYKWQMQVRYRSFSSCRRTFRLQTLTPSAHSTPLLFSFQGFQILFLGHFQWCLCRLRSTHLVWRLSSTPFPCQLPRLGVQKLMQLILRVIKIFFRLPRIGIITAPMDQIFGIVPSVKSLVLYLLDDPLLVGSFEFSSQPLFEEELVAHYTRI